MNATQRSLIDEAHRTATDLDTVSAELNGLVTELHALVEQLGQIEEKRRNG